MAKKKYELSPDDPVVKQFLLGLEAWERPFQTPAKTRGAVQFRGAIRTGGAVPSRRVLVTRGGPRAFGDSPPFALPADDPVVQQFRAGLERWERPFKSDK